MEIKITGSGTIIFKDTTKNGGFIESDKIFFYDSTTNTGVLDIQKWFEFNSNVNFNINNNTFATPPLRIIFNDPSKIEGISIDDLKDLGAVFRSEIIPETGAYYNSEDSKYHYYLNGVDQGLIKKGCAYKDVVSNNNSDGYKILYAEDGSDLSVFGSTANGVAPLNGNLQDFHLFNFGYDEGKANSGVYKTACSSGTFFNDGTTNFDLGSDLTKLAYFNNGNICSGEFGGIVSTFYNIQNHQCSNVKFGAYKYNGVHWGLSNNPKLLSERLLMEAMALSDSSSMWDIRKALGRSQDLTDAIILKLKQAFNLQNLIDKVNEGFYDHIAVTSSYFKIQDEVDGAYPYEGDSTLHAYFSAGKYIGVANNGAYIVNNDTSHYYFISSGEVKNYATGGAFRLNGNEQDYHVFTSGIDNGKATGNYLINGNMNVVTLTGVFENGILMSTLDDNSGGGDNTYWLSITFTNTSSQSITAVLGTYTLNDSVTSYNYNNGAVMVNGSEYTDADYTYSFHYYEQFDFDGPPSEYSTVKRIHTNGDESYWSVANQSWSSGNNTNNDITITVKDANDNDLSIVIGTIVDGNNQYVSTDNIITSDSQYDYYLYMIGAGQGYTIRRVLISSGGTVANAWDVSSSSWSSVFS